MEGANSLPIVGRLSTLRSVHYQKFRSKTLSFSQQVAHSYLTFRLFFLSCCCIAGDDDVFGSYKEEREEEEDGELFGNGSGLFSNKRSGGGLFDEAEGEEEEAEEGGGKRRASLPSVPREADLESSVTSSKKG